jgi:hypothetical protein
VIAVSDLTIERAAARAQWLMRKHKVFQKGVGAYYAPLRDIEFLLHEVAHWLTLGGSIDRVPSRLSHKIGEHFERIPAPSANTLEIDTAMVTYLAGWQLGYWTDPGPIVNSCRRNLQGVEALSWKDDEVYKRFVGRWKAHKRTYVALTVNLVRWFRPSAKLKEFPEAFP